MHSRCTEGECEGVYNPRGDCHPHEEPLANERVLVGVQFIGMEHLLRWERIAVVTDVDWIRHTLRVFSFVVPGVIKIWE